MQEEYGRTVEYKKDPVMQEEYGRTVEYEKDSGMQEGSMIDGLNAKIILEFKQKQKKKDKAIKIPE